MKRTRLNPISKKRRTRVGKVSGTIRLVGEDLTGLRWEVFTRDRGMCQLRIDSECRGFAGWDNGEMSHIKGRGAGGADIPENNEWSCMPCHTKHHAYGPSHQKPCPPKHHQENP